MTSDMFCPICSAGVAECDHEMVRRSYVSGEFEPCAFLPELQTLIDAVQTVLRAYVNHFRLPESSELLEVCRKSCRDIEFTDRGDMDLSNVDVTTYVLGVIQKMPGVVLAEEWHLGHPETLVLWSGHPEAVRQDIQALVRKLEIDASREWVPEWTAVELRALKDTALVALHGPEEDTELTGPYRWGAAGSPRVNVYPTGRWPPEEHVVYFLALPRKPVGLHSSTTVVLDERNLSVVTVGSSGDEG